MSIQHTPEMRNIRIAKADTRNTRSIRLLLSAAGIPIEGTLRRRECWVAIIDGRVIGCSRIEVVGDCGLLRSVAVEKGWRHKGVGSRLVNKSLLQIRSTGRTRIALVTMFWNVNFFRRFGFRTVSRKELDPTLQKVDLFSHPKYRFTTPMLLDPSGRNRKRIDWIPVARGRQHVPAHN
jgi:amino-acid N-acetyltransferase